LVLDVRSRITYHVSSIKHDEAGRAVGADVDDLPQAAPRATCRRVSAAIINATARLLTTKICAFSPIRGMLLAKHIHLGLLACVLHIPPRRTGLRSPDLASI
jgi:hypothetical protein